MSINSNIQTVNWDAPNNVRAIYTTKKTGDLSRKHLNSQNKWQSLAYSLHLPVTIPWINQTHSCEVVKIPQGYGKSADACYTQEINQPCAVQTADCVPILLTTVSGKWVAAIHAGWRGLAKQIIAHSLIKLNHLTPTKEEIIAWIGVCISQINYQVNLNVVESLNKTLVNHKQSFFQLDKTQKNKYYVNLRGIAEQQLRENGVNQIWHCNSCSYADDNFYSFRQNATEKRFASIIWLEKK